MFKFVQVFSKSYWDGSSAKGEQQRLTVLSWCVALYQTLESSTDDLQRDWWWTLLFKTETFWHCPARLSMPLIYTNQGYKSNLLFQWCVSLSPWFTKTLPLPIFLFLIHNSKTLWVVPLNADELEILCLWFSLVHHSEYEASTTILIPISLLHNSMTQGVKPLHADELENSMPMDRSCTVIYYTHLSILYPISSK